MNWKLFKRLFIENIKDIPKWRFIKLEIILNSWIIINRNNKKLITNNKGIWMIINRRRNQWKCIIIILYQ